MQVLLMENAAEGGSEAGWSGAGPDGPGAGPDGPGAGGEEVVGPGAWDGAVVGVGDEGAGVGVGVAGAGAAAGGGVFAVGDGAGADVDGDGVVDGGCVGAGPGACATHAVAKSPNIMNTLTAAKAMLIIRQ